MTRPNTASFPAALAASILAALVAAGGPSPFSRAALAAEESFVAGIDDLPLMPGLVSVDDEPLVFDKPTGRIIQAEARGQVAPAAVRAFYAQTLPQLGWREVAKGRFRREDEQLQLDISESPAGAGQERHGQHQTGAGKSDRTGPARSGPVTVRFTLIPQ